MFAVINLGLKSIRLCLFDPSGRIRYKKGIPLNTVIFGPGVEQDGEEWWSLTRELFHDAHELGHDLGAIEGITVSASASCLVCVDAAGNPLRPIIMVSDRRHDDGSGSGPIMLQRIEWLRRSEPDVFARTAYFLSPNDYLIHRLSGVAVTDGLNAEKSGYSGGAYAAAEDVTPRLPQVAGVGDAVGTMLGAVATELRVNPRAEIFVSSYDAIVSVVGSGVEEEGDVCDVSGTVTSMRMFSKKQGTHPSEAVTCQAMPLLDGYFIGGSNNLGGGLIEWLKTTFYEPSPHVYDVINAEAQSVSFADGEMVLLPYLMGERAPIWDSDCRGVFFGIERTHGRKHFARATIEAAAFVGRSLIEAIQQVHGAPPRRVRLSGGLSRLDICSRIKADVYGMPVEIVAEFESTALGAFLLAFHKKLGLRPGNSGWAKASVKVRDIVLPDEDAAGLYAQRFELFQEIYEALKPVFRKHRQQRFAPVKSEDGFLENL